MSKTRWTHVFAKGTAPHPGICLICGSHLRPVISFPVTQQWNGAMLICTECFTSAITENEDILGFTRESDNAQKIADLEKKLEIASESASAYTKYQEELKGKFNEFVSSNLGGPVIFSDFASSDTRADSLELDLS